MTPAAVDLTGAVEDVPGLSEAVIGIALGTLAGKLVIRRRERRGGELTAVRVRELEARWIAAGVGLALVVGALLALRSS